MRVLLLDSWRTGRTLGSGTAVSIAGLARSLRQAGHDVTLLRPSDASRSVPLLLRRILFNLGAAGDVTAEAPDLVVGFDLDGFALPAGAPYAKVVALKGIAADEARFEAGRPRIGLQLSSFLERRNARRARRVIVPSRYSAGVATDLYGIAEEALRVVPEGIDLAPWRSLAESPPTRRDARPTVLSVARLYPRKNLVTLVRSMRQVRKAISGARLRVVGGGPRTEALARIVTELGLQGSVELLGPVSDDEEVRREYFLADCFCLPSRQEGFGIVFLEAMAAGVPVVAGQAGAAPEVVSHGETGLLVDPEDPRGLASALIRVLSDRALGRRLSAAGQAAVEEYSLARVTERFLAAVEPLTNQPPASA